jgi:hypothetical protein
MANFVELLFEARFAQIFLRGRGQTPNWFQARHFLFHTSDDSGLQARATTRSNLHFQMRRIRRNELLPLPQEHQQRNHARVVSGQQHEFLFRNPAITRSKITSISLIPQLNPTTAALSLTANGPNICVGTHLNMRRTHNGTPPVRLLNTRPAFSVDLRKF